MKNNRLWLKNFLYRAFPFVGKEINFSQKAVVAKSCLSGLQTMSCLKMHIAYHHS